MFDKWEAQRITIDCKKNIQYEKEAIERARKTCIKSSEKSVKNTEMVVNQSKTRIAKLEKIIEKVNQNII